MRLALGFCVLLLAACSRAEAPPARIDGDVRITIEQAREGPWRVVYELKAPRAELDLGYDIDGFRAANWELATKGALLTRRDRRDVVTPIDGRRRLDRLEFRVTPAVSGLRKDYEPFTPMGDGGVLLYTGHFIPYADRTRRLNARLTIVASDGWRVSAFGDAGAILENWRSPLDHPAFVYAGPAAPVVTETMSTVTDAGAPEWIRTEVATFAPAIAGALQQMLARALPTKPNIFVAMGDAGEEGLLSFRGDALPGQYQMTLAGGGWTERSEKAIGVLRLATAHEAAHLWQAAARPRSDAVPDWIHEGGADALAAEAMVAAGYWSSADAAKNFSAARENCRLGLERLSLQRAETENRWDAVYACGHVVNVAAAGRDGVAAFWREFVKRGALEGYDEAMFLTLAEERAGADAAKAIRDLIRINEARPETVIARMFGEASDLAAGQGR